jgi:serine/threonine protein kinase
LSLFISAKTIFPEVKLLKYFGIDYLREDVKHKFYKLMFFCFFFRSSSLSDTQGPGYPILPTTSSTNIGSDPSSITSTNNNPTIATSAEPVQDETTAYRTTRPQEPDAKRQDLHKTKSIAAKAGPVTAVQQSAQKPISKAPISRSAVGSTQQQQQTPTDKRKMMNALATGTAPERGRKSVTASTDIQRKMTASVKAVAEHGRRPSGAGDHAPLKKRDSVSGKQATNTAAKKTSSTVITETAAKSCEEAVEVPVVSSQLDQPGAVVALPKHSKATAQKKSTAIERKPQNALKKVSVERKTLLEQSEKQQEEGIGVDSGGAEGGTRTIGSSGTKRRTSMSIKSSTSRGMGQDKTSSQQIAKKSTTSVDQKYPSEEAGKPTRAKQSVRPLPSDNSIRVDGPVAKKYQQQPYSDAKLGPNKNASLEPANIIVTPSGRPARTHHRPIEKSDSSVSLTRKKFEKKDENNEETSRTLEGTRKLTEPLMPRLKISQNLFLKEDALHKSNHESNSSVIQTVTRPKAKTLELATTRTRQGSPQKLLSQSNGSKNITTKNAPNSGNDTLPIKAHESLTPGSTILPSSLVDIVPSPQTTRDLSYSGSKLSENLSSCSSADQVPSLSASLPVVIQVEGNEEPNAYIGSHEEDSSAPCPLLTNPASLAHFPLPGEVPNEFLASQVYSYESTSLTVQGGVPERSIGGALDNLELPESPAYRSPLLSDSEEEGIEEDIASVNVSNRKKITEGNSSRQHVLEAFVGSTAGGGEEPGLRHRLLSNLVNKRSESDGIVCMDRPRAERPVRRCESIDDGLDMMSGGSSYQQHQTVDLTHMTFPQSIKTVTPATILKGPEDYTAGLGETVYLRAHYFGNPEPRVAWFRSGRRLTVPMASSSDTEMGGDEQRIRIRTYPGESTLVIRDLRADDSGKYEIQIENEVGNDACSASLCVEGPPEPPGGRPYITTIDRDLHRLTLAWYGSTFDGGSMLTGYIVEMSSWPVVSSAAQPEPTDWTVVTSKCHSTSYIVRDLSADREYIFRVRAQNIHGQSAPGKVSEPVCFNKTDDEDDDGLQDEVSRKRGSEADKGDTDEEEEFESPFEHRVVSLEEGSIFKAKFEIYEELGRGRFGVVFKVKNRETREIFAAKFVKCRKQEERDKCKEEIEIMNGLDHSRLLQLAAAYENPREVIMIMEFIGGGELFEKVVADDFTLTEHDCVLFMRQICAAIGYMHQKDIVHLDLKPENILCKSKKSHQIKIIDFGLTRKLKPGEDVRILFGTPEFVSPEVISYEPVSAASDMWSVGVVCYVLLSGLSPFMGDSDVETFSNITGLCYDFEDDAFEHITEDAKDFILNLLVKDQRKRLKALECLKHPWLNQRQSDRRAWKEINTDKLKSFLMRRRWQKAAHAIRALGRFTSLGFRQDSKDSASSISGLSTQSADF